MQICKRRKLEREGGGGRERERERERQRETERISPKDSMSKDIKNAHK